MSIATAGGDGGQTGLAGGISISRAELRVETCGTVDELNTSLGFARIISRYSEIATWTETIQRTLSGLVRHSPHRLKAGKSRQSSLRKRSVC